MAKTDLRIIRTKANITRAFLELMDEFDYDSITVTDICDRAMVNRKTFYTYYETKEHLHQSISDSLLQSLKLEETAMLLTDEDRSSISMRQLLNRIYTLVNKDRLAFKVMLNEKSSARFKELFEDEVRKWVIYILEHDGRSENFEFPKELMVEEFVASGVVLVRWYSEQEGHNISAQQFIHYLMSLNGPVFHKAIGFERELTEL